MLREGCCRTMLSGRAMVPCGGRKARTPCPARPTLASSDRPVRFTSRTFVRTSTTDEACACCSLPPLDSRASSTRRILCVRLRSASGGRECVMARWSASFLLVAPRAIAAAADDVEEEEEGTAGETSAGDARPVRGGRRSSSGRSG